jgi:glutamine synthetase
VTGISAPRPAAPPAGHRARPCNVEVNSFDGAANPYLLLAGLLAAGRAGLRAGATLPDPVGIDPGGLTEEGRREAGIAPLPATLEEAVRAFEADEVLTAAYGTELATTTAEVRRGEIALFEDTSVEGITAAVRRRHRARRNSFPTEVCCRGRWR